MARSAKKRGKLARPRESVVLRLYARTRAVLRWMKLEPWFDFHWRELLLARRARAPSAWDADNLWLGEIVADAYAELAEIHARPSKTASPPPGSRCFAARVDGRWAACLWILVGPARLVSSDGDCAWELPAAAAWAFNAGAHPLYIGTYPDLIRFARGRLRAEGIERFLAQVEYDNRRSRHLHRMLGGAPLGWVFSLRLCTWVIHLERHQNGWRLRAGHAPVNVPLREFLPPLGPQEVAEAGRVGLIAGKDLG